MSAEMPSASVAVRQSARRMFRYVIPVDDRPHWVSLTHDPVAVAAPADDRVEFWAENDPRAEASDRAFLVVGTGHPIPDGARWAGTPPRTALGLVWHLYEVTP